MGARCSFEMCKARRQYNERPVELTYDLLLWSEPELLAMHATLERKQIRKQTTKVVTSKLSTHIVKMYV